MNLSVSKKNLIRKIRDRGRYLCPDCSKSFAREATYIRHQCEPKRRKNEVQTTLAGKLALIYYREWMKFRKVPIITPLENFVKSYSYHSLILFAKYAKQVNITNLPLFFHAISKRGWLTIPGMWRSDEAYAEYIKYIDTTISPDKRVVATLKYLVKIADAAGVDISEIFEVLESGELIALVESRKLSLWFLLRCEKFFTYCDVRLSEEQREIITSIIEDGGWNQKLADNPDLCEKFKKYAVEVGL